MRIPFNKPFFSGKELEYIYESFRSGKISGDGIFTDKCNKYFENNYGLRRVLLTTSCTDALEMSAILCEIKPGDEVIVPSYTFVSTANAFVRQGAKIVFIDSENDTPNMDASKLGALITPKTKAIVPVHYAGMACDMDLILDVAEQHGLYVIEDAAQAIDSYYKGKMLGTLGDLSTFSFHETKNIISGEGGMIVINNANFDKRAEIIREKGTDRSSFLRGEIDKYGWVDIGSSFLPSDIIAAVLLAQLENMESIQNKRRILWEHYYRRLKILEDREIIKLPRIPEYATNNAHMFYIICHSPEERDGLINYLKQHDILAVSHYQSLHNSKYYIEHETETELPNAEIYTNQLARLPLYFELNIEQIDYIADLINKYFSTR